MMNKPRSKYSPKILMTKYVSDQMLSHSFELHDQRMKVLCSTICMYTIEVIKSCGIYQWCYYNSHIVVQKTNLGSQMGIQKNSKFFTVFVIMSIKAGCNKKKIYFKMLVIVILFMKQSFNVC